MRTLRRRTAFAPALVAIGLVLFGLEAHAEPTKLDCIRTNEDGQDQRRAGHFGEAVSRFEACSVRACPASVRDDCAGRRDETRRAFPRIELSVVTATGAIISDAQVTLDGNAQAGAVFNAEPGDHQLAVQAPGFTPLIRKVALREGERLHEAIVMSPAQRDGPPTSTPEGTRSGEAPPAAFGVSQRVISFGVIGLGAVGSILGGVLGVVAKGNYDVAKEACGGTPSKCGSSSAVQAGSDAHSLLTISTITGLAGIAMIGGGVALYLTAPNERGVHATVSPSGLHLGGTW